MEFLSLFHLDFGENHFKNKMKVMITSMIKKDKMMRKMFEMHLFFK